MAPIGVASSSATVPSSMSPRALRSSFAAYASGHAIFAYLAVSGSPVVPLAATAAMWALIANGVATTIRPPTPSTTTAASLAVDPDLIAQRLTAALTVVLNVFDRFKAGEPRITFAAAVGAWGVAHYGQTVLGLASPLRLAWLVFALAFPSSELTLPASFAAGVERARPKVEEMRARAVTFAHECVAPAALAALQAKLPDGFTNGAAAAAASRYAPFVGVVVWYLVLSWHAKALSAGMALLGFKAWASKEANTALHMQSEKAYASVKRSARRVSMAASRGMGSIFSPIKEA